MGDIAADLKAVLPSDRFEVETLVVAQPGDAFRSDYRVLLFAPRIWAHLDKDGQADEPQDTALGLLNGFGLGASCLDGEAPQENGRGGELDHAVEAETY